ncbi:MAG: TIGR04086 family membrane protein [Candidatus Scatosoma sp.]
MFSENVSHSFFFQTAKAAAIATLLCMGLAAGTAALARVIDFSDAAVKIVGVAAKTISLLSGALFSFRGEKGWLKGLLAGILFSLLTCFLFSAASGTAAGARVLFEILFGAAGGAVCGIIAAVSRSR